VISQVGNLVFNSLTLTGGGIKVPGGRQLSFDSLTLTSLSANAVLTTDSPSIAQFSIFKATGIVFLNDLTISGCNATGGATFIAGASSVNGGFNSGIRFANTPNFLAFFT
jgi:hypothetical protein